MILFSVLTLRNSQWLCKKQIGSVQLYQNTMQEFSRTGLALDCRPRPITNAGTGVASFPVRQTAQNRARVPTPRLHHRRQMRPRGWQPADIKTVAVGGRLRIKYPIYSLRQASVMTAVIQTWTAYGFLYLR
jgi:hypothetical protein